MHPFLADRERVIRFPETAYNGEQIGKLHDMYVLVKYVPINIVHRLQHIYAYWRSETDPL